MADDATEIAAEIRERGFAVVGGAFDDELEEMRAAADRVLELLVNSSLANGRTSGRLAMVEDDRQLVKKVQPVNDLSLTFTEVGDDDRLLAPMREYMEDEPRLMEEKLNYKQPLPEPVEGLETDRPTEAWPVHCDWAYFRRQDYPRSVVSSAVALDDLTTANGTVRFWPGTNDEFVEHEVTDNGRRVPPDRVDEDDAVAVEAPAGSVVFFDAMVWHDSSANDTDGPRRLMVYSHYPGEEGERRGIVEDERNAGNRRAESPYEWRYQELKDSGEFTDQFVAPDG